MANQLLLITYLVKRTSVG